MKKEYEKLINDTLRPHTLEYDYRYFDWKIKNDKWKRADAIRMPKKVDISVEVGYSVL